MDIIDHIEDLLEKSRTKQGEAREQIFKTLGRMFDVILDLDGISLAVDKAFGEHAKTITGTYPKQSDQNGSF